MLRFIYFLLLAGAVVGSSAAATPAQSVTGAKSPDAAEAVSGLPAGATICAVLTKALDGRKLKPGDKIEARSTLAVIAMGKVAIPEGTKLAGHVSEATKKSDNTNTSRLGIVFDEALLKNGTKIPLALTVQALGLHPLSSDQIPLETGRPSEFHPPLRNLGQHTQTSPSTPAPTMPPEPTAPDPGSESPVNPTLDAGSHGVIGMEDLSLKESSKAEEGSVVTSTKKNVKLSRGTEIVLRVVSTPDREKSPK